MPYYSYAQQTVGLNFATSSSTANIDLVDAGSWSGSMYFLGNNQYMFDANLDKAVSLIVKTNVVAGLEFHLMGDITSVFNSQVGATRGWMAKFGKDTYDSYYVDITSGVTTQIEDANGVYRDRFYLPTHINYEAETLITFQFVRQKEGIFLGMNDGTGWRLVGFLLPKNNAFDTTKFDYTPAGTHYSGVYARNVSRNVRIAEFRMAGLSTRDDPYRVGSEDSSLFVFHSEFNDYGMTGFNPSTFTWDSVNGPFPFNNSAYTGVNVSSGRLRFGTNIGANIFVDGTSGCSSAEGHIGVIMIRNIDGIPYYIQYADGSTASMTYISSNLGLTAGYTAATVNSGKTTTLGFSSTVPWQWMQYFGVIPQWDNMSLRNSSVTHTFRASTSNEIGEWYHGRFLTTGTTVLQYNVANAIQQHGLTLGHPSTAYSNYSEATIDMLRLTYIKPVGGTMPTLPLEANTYGNSVLAGSTTHPWIYDFGAVKNLKVIDIVGRPA